MTRSGCWEVGEEAARGPFQQCSDESEQIFFLC